MSVMTPEQSTFEAETCGRCGGSGNYSFNQIDGTRCYGCGGSGIKLTKRGVAARAFYRDSQMMPVADLQPGMFVWDDTYGFKPKFLPVLSIKPSKSFCEADGVRRYYINIETRRCSHGVFPDSQVRAVRNEAERQAQLAAALAYQSTLNKLGKPLKRAAAQHAALEA